MSIAALAELGRPASASERVTRSTATQIGTTSRGASINQVDQKPIDLARMAGMSLETYSLARILAGEGYGGGGGYIGETTGRVAEAQATVNKARSAGVSITSLVTRNGYYGNQANVGYATSAVDPNRWECAIADHVIRGAVPDCARGATNFLCPRIYAKELTGGISTQSGGTLTGFQQVMTSWHSARTRLCWIGPVPALNPYELLLLRKEPSEAKRAESYQAIMKLWREGAAGKNMVAPGSPDMLGNLVSTLAVMALIAGGAYYAGAFV